MKILFDQNLSPKLVKLLAAEFPGSIHVIEIGLDDAPDPDIWNYAKAHGMVIASKDEDYQYMAINNGPPPKVIWIQVGNCPTFTIAQLFKDNLKELVDFEANPFSALTILP